MKVASVPSTAVTDAFTPFGGSYLGASGRARYAVTDRHGIRATGSRPSAQDADAPTLGASVGPYARLDLARHVGDAAHDVDANRAAVARALDLESGAMTSYDQVKTREFSRHYDDKYSR